MRSGWLKVVTILARVLPPAARQRVLDRLVPLLAGATVLAFAAGSSSIPRITSIGHPLRWAVLVALLGATALWALPRPSAPRTSLVAAAALVGLAVLSTAWSVEPRTTLERAGSLGLLFATCLVLAAAAAGRPDRVAALLYGLLAGAVVVGLLGLLLLWVAHGDAVTVASTEAPARYRGFGQDPNTVALLFAVAVPIGTWAVATARRRALPVACVVLCAGTIAASGSRGALAAATVGALVVALAIARRRRVVAVAVVVAAAVAGGWIAALPKAAATNPPAPVVHAGPAAKPGYLNAELSYPLSADVGQPLPGGGQPPVTRSFFGSSGRVDAWRGALHETARRPVAGHGFGTEQAVFVDRYYRFVGGLPENSYVGMALQLGAAGLVALAALVVALALAGFRALAGPRRELAAAGLGVLAAGLVVAVVQSYLYSVGNIAAAALWIPAFLLPAVARA
jgi:O-antigen ligase